LHEVAEAHGVVLALRCPLQERLRSRCWLAHSQTPLPTAPLAPPESDSWTARCSGRAETGSRPLRGCHASPTLAAGVLARWRSCTRWGRALVASRL